MKKPHAGLTAIFTAASMLLATTNQSWAAANPPIPDLTRGGKPDGSHDWMLGPTGARGWMAYRQEDLTAASRQILVTAVDKGSPADGLLRVNDVVLGVFGKPFADDSRRSFGHAIAAAEEKTGILPLIVWRGGKTSNVDLKLQVFGAYSATTPYDCPKSRAIFEQGCRLIAEKGFEETDIPDHLNALALLASGDKKYHPMLRKYAEQVAEALQPADTWNWYIGYGNLFLAEYVLATGDKTRLPDLQETTLHAVRNQCMNGLWGHEPSNPGGNSPGYGGKSQISLPVTISLVLARQAGVSDPGLDKAIEKYATFARYYVDKGAVPYFQRKDDELIDGLKSWSPVVRRRSADAIGKRGGNFAPKLIEMLTGSDRHARYGATEALGKLGKDALSAHSHLRELLKDPDLWLRSLAADALVRLGAKDSVGDLIAMSLRPTPADPRRMYQRAASRALFSPYPGESEPVSLLAESLDGVDRQQLHLVMKSFLENDDSVVRAAVIPALEMLDDRDLVLLLPTLVKAIERLAPTNEMWSEDIRLAGLDILSRHHIREGMSLCVSSIEWRWEINVEQRMEFLQRYGQNARDVLPAIRKIVGDIDQKGDSVDLGEERKFLTKAIAKIEASRTKPELVSLEDFIAHTK